VATRISNAPRPFARRVRRVLLTTAVACPLIAAPASAFTLNPTLLAAPVAGQTATCLPGIVGPLPLGSLISFSWGNWGTQVFPNSNSNSITLAKSSGGQFIFCEVTVKPPLLSAVTAAAIAQVKGIAPSNVSLPSVAGKKRVGQTVTCKPGNWTAVPSSYSFRWLRNGVGTSTGRTRTLTKADRGQSVACRVTAHNPFGTSPAATSPSVSVQ
jgi:hypothetical protein